MHVTSALIWEGSMVEESPEFGFESIGNQQGALCYEAIFE